MPRLPFDTPRAVGTRNSVYELSPVAALPVADARLLPGTAIWEGTAAALRTDSSAVPAWYRGLWLPVADVGITPDDRLTIAFPPEVCRATCWELGNRALTSPTTSGRREPAAV